MHGDLGSILFGILPFVPLVLIMFVPNRFFGSKALNQQLEESRKQMAETRVTAERRHQEAVNFQRELLAELKRHNATMEQHNQLLARLLERQA